MAYQDAPEFQTSASGGYSPDRFYVDSKMEPHGDRRWVTIRAALPAEMYARTEDLIHARAYPAYRTVADVLRDSLVHHLYRRLSELNDPYWERVRDIYANKAEVERLRHETEMAKSLCDDWHDLLNKERDPERRQVLLNRAKEQIDGMPSEYWAAELRRVIQINGG